MDELGICPAAVSCEYDGVNKGKYGGRFCWVIAGTFCGGKPQGTYVEKLTSCIECEFFKQVNEDESGNFTFTPKDAKERHNK